VVVPRYKGCDLRSMRGGLSRAHPTRAVGQIAFEAATAFSSGFASISANMTRMPASAKAWFMASPMSMIPK
jgi:hypothetical protein